MTRGVGPRGLLLAAALGLVALAASAAGTPRAQAAPLADVCGALQDEAAARQARVGFVVLDLTDYSRCSYQATDQFVTASLYKLVVLAEVYEQAEAGTFSLDESIAMVVPQIDDEGELTGRTTTVVVSAAEAVRRMIQISDNEATHALRARLGVGNVADRPPQLGMFHTSIDDREGADFMSTPSDIAHFFSLLYAGRLVGAESDGAMMDVLLGQDVNDRIPWLLPDEVPVAHKTGQLDLYAHDAGIVFAPGGDFVLVLMAEANSTQDEGYEAIRDLAALAYTAYADPRPVAVSSPLPVFAPLVAVEGAEAAGPLQRTGSPIVALPGDEAAEVAPVVEQPAGAGDGGRIQLPALGLASLPEPWWLTPAGLAALAAVIALFPAAVLGRRRREPAAAAVASQTIQTAPEIPVPHALQLMAGGSRMRLMNGKRSVSGVEAVQTLAPAEERPIERVQGVVVQSPRLRRLAGYFAAQMELIDEMSRQIEEEAEPLHELLDRQSQTIDRVMDNLDARLGPIRDYAAGEESNLQALQERMSGEGMEFVARSFSDYVSAQRQRIEETRSEIGRQREPFEQLAEDERDTVERALRRFDGEIDALEGNLEEQRRVMRRLLETMRSEDFQEVKEYLHAREQVLEEAARQNVTDPSEIAAGMQSLRRALRSGQTGNEHLEEVLDEATAVDDRLMSAGQRPAVRAMPRALPPDENVDEEETDTARTSA